MRPASDAGAGSVLAVALCGAVVLTVAVMLPLYMSLAARQSVVAAADAAALAAADVAVGIRAGFPCELAAEVAAANGASLAFCEVDGLVATVSTRRNFLGFSLTARATAGPPGESPD